MGDSSSSLLQKGVHVSLNGRQLTLSLNSSGEVEGTYSPKHYLIYPTSIYDVLWAGMEGNNLEFSYLDRRRKGKSTLKRIFGQLAESTKADAEQWCKCVMAAAYTDTKPQRKLKVLINPIGGPGKARQIYASVVKPIFDAARCSLDTTFTERSKHASEIASKIPAYGQYDALALLSGDGLIHEVFNGFAEHDDPLKAFSIPIAPIPTGSGNGTAINLLGLEEGFDVGVATLNAIKGKPMKQDICSMTIDDKRIFTFMSQALGLMADLDLGTEHLRWMGDVRFILGFIYGVFKLKNYPMTLAIKPSETDKDRMVEEFRAKAAAHRRQYEMETHDHEVGDDSLPVLKHTEEPHEDEGWITFDKPIIYFYGGKCPFVGRDMMSFPVAHASDGLIDIVAQERTSRLDLLSAIFGAEKGAHFWKETQHYFKAHAYRITPQSKQGYLSIDGEAYPLQEFTVECHRGLGTFLSPFGRYATDFDVPRPKSKGKSKKGKQGMAHIQLEVIDEGGVRRRKGLKKVLPCLP